MNKVSFSKALLFSAMLSQFASAAEVELLHAFSNSSSYRGHTSQSTEYDILVEDLGVDKTVTVVGVDVNGEWQEIPASYYREAGDGFEIWRATESYCSGAGCYAGTTTHDLEFVVRYNVNGEEYYDNNSGNNFTMTRNSGNLLTSPVIWVDQISELPAVTSLDAREVSGDIVVKNLGADKAVTVHYTLDGGVSWLETAAEFYNGYYSPFTRYSFPNPSEEHGTELWQFEFDAGSAEAVSFYVSYEVNGETYYANNYDRNYVQYAKPFHALFARGTHNEWTAEVYPQTYGDPQATMLNATRDYEGNFTYTATIKTDGAGDENGPDRFKFDVLQTGSPYSAELDWSYNLGDNEADGVLDDYGLDIQVPGGFGQYAITVDGTSREYTVEAQDGPDWRRTVILIYGRTNVGQDMFFRGGIDSNWSNANRGTSCNSAVGGEHNEACSIPINHMNYNHQYTQPWRSGDNFLDWGKLTPARDGREAEQDGVSSRGETAVGSPAVWTTDDCAYPNVVSSASYDEVCGEDQNIQYGSGFDKLNTYGEHYWMLDVTMDCSATVGGWFEFKTFISNGPGWEGNINQTDFQGLTPPPYTSINHMGFCGKVNVFRSNQDNPVEIKDF